MIDELTPTERRTLAHLNHRLVDRLTALHEEFYRAAMDSNLGPDVATELVGWISVALDHAQRQEYQMAHSGPAGSTRE